MRLTSDEFYALTPRQLDALIKRKEIEAEDQEFMLAQLTSAVINFSMARPETPVKAHDLMPSQWRKGKFPDRETKQKRVRITKAVRERVALQCRTIFGALAKRSNPHG